MDVRGLFLRIILSLGAHAGEPRTTLGTHAGRVVFRRKKTWLREGKGNGGIALSWKSYMEQERGVYRGEFAMDDMGKA